MLGWCWYFTTFGRCMSPFPIQNESTAVLWCAQLHKATTHNGQKLFKQASHWPATMIYIAMWKVQQQLRNSKTYINVGCWSIGIPKKLPHHAWMGIHCSFCWDACAAMGMTKLLPRPWSALPGSSAWVICMAWGEVAIASVRLKLSKTCTIPCELSSTWP